MVAVQNLEKVDDAAEAFSKIGYEYLGEFGIAGRRYLRKGGDERTHQIHIFQTEDWNNIGRHLAFRDYMRTHKKERDEYAKIKSSCTEIPYDIDGYCDGKEEFVRKIEKLALPNLMEHGIKCTLRHEMYRKKERFPLVEAGGVSASNLLKKGISMLVFVSILLALLGMCAERNAIANMITNGENGICRLIAVDRNGKAIPPCGACREFMVQLMPDHYHSIQIMMDYENKKMVTLGDITPNWWI